MAELPASAPPAPIETDALIVGAGPVALFAVFELGLLEVGARVVDSLPFVGGQCVELYAAKPIYDIPALPFATGAELIERLQAQIAPFGAGFHLGQQVSALAAREDGRFDIATDAGQRFVAKAVVIAAGVGSFQPRGLKIEGLAAWRERQLFHRDPGAAATAGRRVVIVGNGEAAVAAALDAVEAGASSVTVVHRRDDFDAPAAELLRFQSARKNDRIEVVTAQPSGIESEGDVLLGLVVNGSDGGTRTLSLDRLLVLLGWSPKLGPIAQWGLALERKQLVVDTERFETSTKGIHAIGDAITYPGKQKLIVSGFHEATLAAYAIAGRVHPDRAQPLLYTTTSPKLHKLLGVDPANPSPPSLR
ncbi:MAG: NAD(P)/FAD-dependent oxidoreductase [Caldimonas sp.]